MRPAIPPAPKTRGSSSQPFGLRLENRAAPRCIVAFVRVDGRFDLRDASEIGRNAVGAIVGSHSAAGFGRHEQAIFRVDERSAAVVRHFEARRQDDRVGGTRLFAHTAENAAELVDLVARGVAFAGRTPIGGRVFGAYDRDRVGGTDARAKLAADAALFAVAVPAQFMQAVKT